MCMVPCKGRFNAVALPASLFLRSFFGTSPLLASQTTSGQSTSWVWYYLAFHPSFSIEPRESPSLHYYKRQELSLYRDEAGTRKFPCSNIYASSPVLYQGRKFQQGSRPIGAGIQIFQPDVHHGQISVIVHIVCTARNVREEQCKHDAREQYKSS